MTPTPKTLYKAMHQAARAAKHYGRDQNLGIHPIAVQLGVVSMTPYEAAHETAKRLEVQGRVRYVRAATLFMKPNKTRKCRSGGFTHYHHHDTIRWREPHAFLYAAQTRVKEHSPRLMEPWALT